MIDEKEDQEIQRIINLTADFWDNCSTEIAHSRYAGYFFYTVVDGEPDGISLSIKDAITFARCTFAEMILQYSYSFQPHIKDFTGKHGEAILSKYKQYLEALPEYAHLFFIELASFSESDALQEASSRV